MAAFSNNNSSSSSSSSSIFNNPLSSKEYSQVFETYLSTSTEYDAMKKLGIQVIMIKQNNSNNNNRQQLSRWRRILSIRTGTGEFEFDLFQSILFVDNGATTEEQQQPLLDTTYVIVEPNKNHIDTLHEKTTSSWLSSSSSSSTTNKIHILNEYFTSTTPSTQKILEYCGCCWCEDSTKGNKNNNEEEEDDDNKFDLILLSHSFYYLENRPEILKRLTNELLSSTNNDAMIVTWIQTEGIVTQLCNQFLIKSSSDQQQPHLLTDRMLLEELAEVTASETNLVVEHDTAESHLSIKNQKQLSDVISFILQKNFTTLPIGLQNEILDYVTGIATDAFDIIVEGEKTSDDNENKEDDSSSNDGDTNNIFQRMILPHDSAVIVWRRRP